MPRKPFRLPLAMALAASAAMLSACATSPDERPRPAADPVIETKTVEVRVCPAELLAARPLRPAVPEGAEMTGNPAGLAWLTALSSWGALLDDRLADAAKECASLSTSQSGRGT